MAHMIRKHMTTSASSWERRAEVISASLSYNEKDLNYAYMAAYMAHLEAVDDCDYERAALFGSLVSHISRRNFKGIKADLEELENINMGKV